MAKPRFQARVATMSGLVEVLCAGAILAGLQGCDDVEIPMDSPVRSPGISAVEENRQVMARPLPADLVTGQGGPGSRHYSGLGMNLSGFDYYSTDFPTIDQFKRASPWVTSNDNVWDTGEEEFLDLDENGWVRSLPDRNDGDVRYRKVVAVLFQGDGGAHPAGDYTVLYEGSGTVVFGGATVVSQRQGHAVVRLAGKGSDSLTVSITATTPGNHVRNIRVIPPGGVCSLARTVYVKSAASCTTNGTGDYVSLETLSEVDKQVWFPTFLSDLSGMRTLRFMDWGRTNESKLASWADRPKWDDATWTGGHGVPVGVMINLANAIKADAWINLPTRAENEYARGFARLAKASLNPSAKLIVEYSNEPWNWAYPFINNYNWQYDRAVEDWGDPNTDGNSNTWPHLWVQNWNAMRSADLCDIIKGEFGADAGRVQCVVNTQAGGGVWYALEASLKCPVALGDRGGRPCADSFDAVAIAPYFGSYLGNPWPNAYAVHREILRNWMDDDDGGMGKLFEEIRKKDANDRPIAVTPLHDLVLKEAPNGAVAQSRSWMETYRDTIARNPDPRYRKPIVAYEGGQHLSQSGYQCKGKDDPNPDPPDCPEIEAAFRTNWKKLMIDANRDPRMGKALEEMMTDWRATEGQTFVHFNFVGSFSEHGAWGLRESLFHGLDSSPKWKAMLPYRDSVPCWWTGCRL